MATHRRRLQHTSCRVNKRGGIGPRGSNNPRQTQIATMRYERFGKLIGESKGHKAAGWIWNFPDRPWSPADEKLNDNKGIPLNHQKLLRRD